MPGNESKFIFIHTRRNGRFAVYSLTPAPKGMNPTEEHHTDHQRHKSWPRVLVLVLGFLSCIGIGIGIVKRLFLVLVLVLLKSIGIGFTT